MVHHTHSSQFDAVEAAHEELQADHATLHELVAEIRSARESTRLTPTLRRLHTLLDEHFAREEHPGGFYASLADLDMGFHDRVDELVDEHKRILAATRHLLEGIAESRKHDPAHLDGARSIADWLGRHEDLEHRLAEEAAALLI